MSDDTNVSVELDLVDGGSVNEVNKLAQAMAAMFEKGASLETTLNRLFGETLPGQIAALRGQLEELTLDANANISKVPVKELNKRLGTAATVLRGGGASTVIETAAQAGEIARIRNDGGSPPAALDAEKETNKTLAARQEIYRRIADQGEKNGSDPGQVNAAYTRASRKLGDKRDGAEILTEAQGFQTARVAAAEAADAKIQASHDKAISNYERVDARALDAQETRRKTAEAARAKRAEAAAAAKAKSDTAAFANYERTDAAALNRRDAGRKATDAADARRAAGKLARAAAGFSQLRAW